MADGSSPLEPTVNVPPHDLDAEAAVLSSMFLDPTVIVSLDAEHFYADANAWIYRAISVASPDIVLVAHWLREQGRLDQIGGQRYLAQIVDATPAVANVWKYADIVKECWRRRVLIAAFQRCVAELYAGSLAAGDAWKRMKECCDA
jgi:replicative DNA helicase